jgi:outer membrane protein assembly factor BamB
MGEAGATATNTGNLKGNAMTRLCLLLFLASAMLASAEPAADPRALWTAARTNDVKAIEELVAKGVDVNVRNEIGISALWLAAEKEHLDAVKALIRHKADVNVRDGIWYQTPLSQAAAAGQVEMVRVLLESGAKGADAALLATVGRGKEELLRVLLDKGKITGPALGASLLLAPADNKKVRELLKEAGAEPLKPASEEERAAWVAFAGDYQNDNGSKIKVEVRDGVLLAGPAAAPYVLQPAGDAFRPIGHESTTFTFERTGKTASRVVLKRYTAEITYTRISPDALPKPTTPAEESGTVRVTEAKNWPSFRGLDASGVADGQQPPVTWDAGKDKNVLWKTAIPGLGHSCPVVWGDRVFLTTAISGDPDPKVRTGNYGDVDSVDDKTKHTWQVLCLDRTTGKILWTKTAHEGVPKIRRHLKGSQANSTPVTDGKRIVACFGSEGLYCYNFEGKQLWKRDLGTLDSSFLVFPEIEWGFGSSPVLHDGMVFLQCDLSKDSFIAAYSLEDGQRIWSTPRDDIASWSSPVIWKTPRRTELVTNGSQYARGYDPQSGKELWRLAKKSECTIPTPITGRGLLFLTSGNRPIQPIFALRPDAAGDISLKDNAETSEQVVWSRLRGGPYMTTPILYGEHLYTCSNNGVVTCYEADTGKQVYKERLGGETFTASPVAADGRLYFTSEQGDVRVVKAGPRFELLAVNPVGDPCLATPAISGGMFFVRSQHFLFAFGRKDGRK